MKCVLRTYPSAVKSLGIGWARVWVTVACTVRRRRCNSTSDAPEAPAFSSRNARPGSEHPRSQHAEQLGPCTCASGAPAMVMPDRLRSGRTWPAVLPLALSIFLRSSLNVFHIAFRSPPNSCTSRLHIAAAHCGRTLRLRGPVPARLGLSTKIQDQNTALMTREREGETERERWPPHEAAVMHTWMQREAALLQIAWDTTQQHMASGGLGTAFKQTRLL